MKATRPGGPTKASYYGKGRRCEVCGSPLSAYNPDTRCRVHPHRDSNAGPQSPYVHHHGGGVQS